MLRDEQSMNSGNFFLKGSTRSFGMFLHASIYDLLSVLFERQYMSCWNALLKNST